MLRDLQLKVRYRSSDDDLLTDFYLPCLGEATSYWRAVGYFSSHALAAAAEGLPQFIERGGTMRLIASPDLSDPDVEAIQRGYEARETVVERALVRALEADQPDPVRERLGYLAWLIAHDRLDIKIALVDSAEPGIYHEKIGVFIDESGSYVAFEGSANESRGGLIANFESLFAFRSERGDQQEIASGLRADFERMWDDQTPRLRVLTFPEAAQNELLTRYLPSTRPRLPENLVPTRPSREVPSGPATPRLPDDTELRQYQRDAMASWFKNEGRGLFAMATGTGKTVTALALISRLYEALAEQDRTLVTVVLCPYQHLVSQWAEEARRFGMEPVLCFQSRESWFGKFAAQLDECRQGQRPFAIAIATNATFQTEAFQRLAGELPASTLLVADEAHNVGAASMRALLPKQVRYRLGLSATPERWYDEEGTAALVQYFGEVTYELGLEKAIKLQALTPYDYFPLVVELQGAELEEYLELTKRISMRWNDGDLDSDPVLKQLLIKRARILSVAEGKLATLQHAIAPLTSSTHNLIYCGDGQVDYEPAGETTRQLDAVVHLLGRGLGMAVNSYTAETYLGARDELRQRFASGTLQALVAIRCLDEGVDIPETERAFILASSTNPKQFIQRRGRVLRRHPGKTKASIYDFITVPPADSIASDHFHVERSLVRREVERVALFARLALNGPRALGELESLRKHYNLLHIA